MISLALACALLTVRTPTTTSDDIDRRIAELKSSDTTVRKAAAEAISSVEYTEAQAKKAIGPLIAALKEPDEEVRRAIVAALARRSDERVVQELIPLLKDSDWGVQVVAAQAVAKDPAGFEAVVSLLADPVPGTRFVMVGALGMTGDRRAVESIIPLLDDADTSVRLATVVAMERLRDARAVPGLIVLLGKSDAFMRSSVLHALGAIGDKRAIDSIVPLIADDELGYAASMALGEIRDRTAVEPMLALLTHKRLEVRQRAASTLGRLKDPRAFKPLARLLRGHDQFTRQAAIYALGELGDSRVARALIPMVDDSDHAVRHTAALVLGALTPATSDESLLVKSSARWLKHPDPRVRALGVRLLAARGDQKAIEPALKLLTDSDLATTMIAADALGKLKSERAVEPLFELMKADDWRKLGAIVVLGEIGDPRAIERLLRALDENPEYSNEIATALGGIGGSHVIEHLKKRSDDKALVAFYARAVKKAEAEVRYADAIVFLDELRKLRPREFVYPLAQARIYRVWGKRAPAIASSKASIDLCADCDGLAAKLLLKELELGRQTGFLFVGMHDMSDLQARLKSGAERVIQDAIFTGLKGQRIDVRMPDIPSKMDDGGLGEYSCEADCAAQIAGSMGFDSALYADIRELRGSGEIVVTLHLVSQNDAAIVDKASVTVLRDEFVNARQIRDVGRRLAEEMATLLKKQGP